MLPSTKRNFFSSTLFIISICIFSLVSCSLDKRIEFANQDKIGLETGSKPCTEFANYTRWFAFYGLLKLSRSEPQLSQDEGKVYFAEHTVNWWQGGLNLVTGFFSSIVFYKVKVSECDLGTRFVHKDNYEKFFEDEREKARDEFFAKTERELEEGLRKYLDKAHSAENAGKNYSTVIYRTGKVLEARVIDQDTESIKVEWDDSKHGKQEATIPKKEIYKVVFATKVIRVKDTGKEAGKDK